MMRQLGLFVAVPLLLLNAPVAAIEFGQVRTVAAAGQGVFHHLEGSGRRSMAMANDTLAITWEDNSSGTPQIYVAFKHARAEGFSKPVQVSAQGPAYEPVIASVEGQFVIGWEAAERLWLRPVSPTQQGEIVRLSERMARHLSLASTPAQGIVAVWGEQHGRHYHIAHGHIELRKNQLTVQAAGLVDGAADKTEQLYPAVAATQAGLLVGWEDRRQGATRIYTAFAPSGKGFRPAQVLNEFVASPNEVYGRGTGAMRIVLDSDLNRHVVAVWLDKRHFEGGYDAYAAYSRDGGRSFGKNERIYDLLGEHTPQWHVTVAMNTQGDVLAAWDDTRDGSPDIWYSRRVDARWSDDEIWPAGGGAGAQTLPVLLFAGKDLHAAWLHRDGEVSEIRYIQARFD
ncbi:MAG: hypothetical protein R6X06_09305 [Gammaproteobacteria bacterium]